MLYKVSASVEEDLREQGMDWKTTEGKPGWFLKWNPEDWLVLVLVTVLVL